MSWLTGAPLIKILSGIAVALFLLTVALFFRSEAAISEAARYEAENKNLRESLTSARNNHLALSRRVVNTKRRLDAEIESSAALQKELLLQIDENENLDNTVAEQANLLREQERKMGREIQTFDTRGIR